MAVRGQKFSLDLDAENFKFDVHDDVDDDGSRDETLETFNIVKGIKEREPTTTPPPPKLKSKTGFPTHRPRKNVSAFKQRQQEARDQIAQPRTPHSGPHEPSDRAIAHQIGKKYGFDTEAKEKTQISKENEQRIQNMSLEDIEEARSELLANLNPALVQRLLKRANIDEDRQDRDWDKLTTPQAYNPSSEAHRPDQTVKKVSFASSPQIDDEDELQEENILDAFETAPTPLPPTTTHFPVPPRDAEFFVALDPDSDSFLADLKTHYFPDTPHDPNILNWLQDPTTEEKKESPYAPEKTGYAASAIRFDFSGKLVPPTEAENIPVEKGLHHHGDAPSSAGYTIPELAMLSRSTLPNQRCIAYRTLGRILYRLGRGDFGPRGNELSEGLWTCIEKERPIEVMMTEANKVGGHVSAKSYATDALWLWRKGNAGDRGLLKAGENVVR